MSALDRYLAPLRRRVSLMVGRAVISYVNDGATAQSLQLGVLADEIHDSVERFQDYGFTSVPHAGAEAAVVFVGGTRSHGIVVACEDRRYRLRGLQGGEVALYDDLGQCVKLGRDRITVSSPTKVEVLAPEIDLTATTKVAIAAPEIDLTATTKIALSAPEIDLTATTKAAIGAPEVDLAGETTVSVTAPSIALDAATGLAIAAPVAVTGAVAMTGALSVDGDVALDGAVSLGAAGGAAVARVGDTVNLTTGKILTGSAEVTAG